MKLFFILPLVVLFFSPSSFSQWSWQSNLPQGNDLYAVCCIDSNTCMAVGAGGTIIRTTDGGVTWQRQHSGTTANFLAVTFANLNNGVVAGDSGIVLNTTNGGLDWIRRNSQTSTRVTGASALNSLTFCIVSLSGGISKSSDGGITWVFKNIGNNEGLSCISFSDAKNGIAAGYSGIIVKTVDGGDTWTALTVPEPYDFHSVVYRDTDRIYSPAIMSSDGGITWTKLNFHNTSSISCLSISAKDRGVAISNGGEIFRTIDGGETWDRYVPDPSLEFLSISFSDSLHGMLVGASGVLFKTVNGGITWIQVSKLLTQWDLFSVSLGNYNFGIASGLMSTLLKSSDSGFHWEKIFIPPDDEPLTGCYSINEQKALVFSHSGFIYLTKDAGNSWTLIAGAYGLNDITFPNENNGIIVGDTILKSTDGGETWRGITRVVENTLYSVRFPEPTTGYAAGVNATLVKTIDGGESWTKLETGGDFNDYYGISFSDSDNGAVVGSNGTILHTSDGGKTWSKQLSGVSQITLFDIFFNDKLHGTAIGLMGTILHTTDGGNNWVQLEPVTANLLRKICFVDVNNGIIVGDKGTILHTTNGGISFINDSPASLRPANFELSQNYPNPFNPGTTIDYKLPHAGLVILKIYNILGREIKTLVNETQTAGKHSVAFNADHLSNGVYFYQLTVDGFQNVKKMLLLK